MNMVLSPQMMRRARLRIRTVILHLRWLEFLLAVLCTRYALHVDESGMEYLGMRIRRLLFPLIH